LDLCDNTQEVFEEERKNPNKMMVEKKENERK